MKVFTRLFFALISCLFLTACCDLGKKASAKSIVFAYGNSVHLWGDHENRLMAEVLAELVNANTPYNAEAVDANSPDLESKMQSADAVIVISEGESHHPFKGEKLALLKQAKNFGAYHYALDFGTKEGNRVLLEKIGGTFEQNWSVNPMFHAKFEVSELHPSTHGVKPFDLDDEWYFNMRFAENGKVTELLKTVPPAFTRKKSFGPHSGNQFVRDNQGRSETILWVFEKDDGTRGLGFTGGHSLFSLYDKNLRRLLLNSAIWLAHGDVPKAGFDSHMPSFDALSARITKDRRADYDSYTAKWKKIAEPQ